MVFAFANLMQITPERVLELLKVDPNEIWWPDEKKEVDRKRGLHPQELIDISISVLRESLTPITRYPALATRNDPTTGLLIKSAPELDARFLKYMMTKRGIAIVERDNKARHVVTFNYSAIYDPRGWFCNIDEIMQYVSELWILPT